MGQGEKKVAFGVYEGSDKEKRHCSSLHFQLMLLFQHLVGTSVLGFSSLLRNCENCRCTGCGSILSPKFQSTSMSLSGFFSADT